MVSLLTFYLLMHCCLEALGPLMWRHCLRFIMCLAVLFIRCLVVVRSTLCPLWLTFLPNCWWSDR
jgi:hypothetical protein